MIKAKGFLYLTFVCGITLCSAWAEEISYQGLKLVFNDSDNGARITLERHKSKTAIMVERLDNPPRLVIDVPKHKIGGNRTFTLSNSRFITAARFGVHPDKTRIVLDLRPELSEVPSFKLSGESADRTLLVLGNELSSKPKLEKVAATPIELTRITPDALRAEAPPAEPIPAIQPKLKELEPNPLPVDKSMRIPVTEHVQTPELTAVQATEATPEPTALPTATPAQTATPKVNPTMQSSLGAVNAAVPVEHRPKPAKGKILSEINFTYLGSQQSPVLKIALGERTEFRLAKTDTRFYTITIPSFGVAGKHLLLPFFPPKDFVGFSVVTTKETAAGIEISIGVDPGFRLMAFADGNSILVKVP